MSNHRMIEICILHLAVMLFEFGTEYISMLSILNYYLCVTCL